MNTNQKRRFDVLLMAYIVLLPYLSLLQAICSRNDLNLELFIFGGVTFARLGEIHMRDWASYMGAF